MNKKIAAIISVVLIAIIGVFSIGMKSDINIGLGGNTITVVDSDGNEVELPKNAERVVVFDYGVADILKNLGVEIVGLPKDGNLPDILAEYADDKYGNVGSLKTTDFEALEALNPDLIIVGGRQAEDLESFEEIAPTVKLSVSGETYVESFKKVVRDCGNLFDKQDKAEEAIANIEKRIASIGKTVSSKKLTATVVMANNGGLSLFSQASRYGIIYSDLGFKQLDNSIQESTHGQQITFEYFLETQSDYVFVVDRGDITGSGDSAKSMFNNEIMNKTEVAKNDNIVYLNSTIWYTMTGGIESTNEMIDEIENAIK